MSERTRLDEIREKWVNAPALFAVALLDAFRHGVEQARKDEDTRRRGGIGAVFVDPAPAERRKGQAERRANQSAKNFVHGRDGEPSGPIYQENDHGSFMYERRTSSCIDRRGCPCDKRGAKSRVGDGHPYKPPVGLCSVDGCGVAAYLHDPLPPWRAPPGWESPEGTFWILRKVAP